MLFNDFMFTSFCHLDTKCQYKKKWAQHNAEPIICSSFFSYLIKTLRPFLM